MSEKSSTTSRKPLPSVLAFMLGLAMSLSSFGAEFLQVQISGSAGPVSGAFEPMYSLSASFEPTSPGANDGVFGVSPGVGPGGGMTFGSRTIRMKPGKSYALGVVAWEVGVFHFNITPPPGYRVEIDGMIREQFLVQGPPGNTFGGILGVRLVDLSEVPGKVPSVPAGVASGLGQTGVQWQVGLGSLLNGGSAGVLRISDAGGGANWNHLYSPNSISYSPPSAEIKVYPVGGPVRQIVANETVVNIVTNANDPSVDAGTYQIRFYRPGQKNGASYPFTFSGLPFATYIVASGGTSASLSIRHQARDLDESLNSAPLPSREMTATVSRTGSWPEYSWTVRNWYNTSGAAVNESYTTSTGTESARTETTLRRNVGSSNVAEHATRSFSRLSNWGERETASSQGTSNPDGVTNTYWTSGAASGTYGYLRSRTVEGGGWEAYEYHPAIDGLIKRRYRPYNDSPATAPSSFDAAVGEVTSYTYSNDVFGKKTRLWEEETTINGVLVARAGTTYANATGPAGLPLLVATRKERVSSSSADELTTVVTTFREDTPDAFFRGMTHSFTGPDEVKLVYAYQRGTWSGETFTPSSGGGTATGTASCLTVIKGTSSIGSAQSTFEGYPIDTVYLVAGKSTAQLTFRDSRALVVRTETRVWTGSSWAQLDYEAFKYTPNGRLEERKAQSGRVLYNATYLGDRKQSETDETGITLIYSYDAAGRPEIITKASGGPLDFDLKTKLVYNGADKVVEKIVSVDPDNTSRERLVTVLGFDTAGRLISQKEPGLSPTTYFHQPSFRKRTTTFPDGGTRIEEDRVDGRPLSVTGSAVVAQYFSYGVETNGRLWHKVHMGSSSSARWIKTTSDWLGRPIEIIRPGFSEGSQPGDFVESYFYDDATVGKGRLYLTARSGLAPVRYAYDELGRSTTTGIDLGPEGLQAASADRITETDVYFSKDTTTNFWWLVSSSTTYPKDGSAAEPLTLFKEVQVSGLTSSQIAVEREIDAESNVVIRTTTVNRAGKTVNLSVAGPCNCSVATQTAINGFLMSTVTRDSLTFDTDYDELGRKTHDVDPRTGSVVTEYYPNSLLIKWIKDAGENFLVRRGYVNGAFLASSGYDAAGRVKQTVDANGAIGYFSYNHRGQVLRQWGTAIYPSEFEYDSFGARKALRTWNDSTIDFAHASAFGSSAYPSASGNVTTWIFDEASGLLSKKVDAAKNAVEFDYNIRGQVKTRYWARTLTSSNTRLKTEYDYYPGTGELHTITYNDSGEPIPTPGVTYEYSRLGQLEKVIDGTGTRTFSPVATAPWRMEHEKLSAEFGSRWLTQAFDSSSGNAGTFATYTRGKLKGRTSGYALGVVGNLTRDLQVEHVYASDQRFVGVRNRFGAGTVQEFVYSYKTNSQLMSGYTTGAHFAVERDYDLERDLLKSIEGKWGQSTLSRFDYKHTRAGQRKVAEQSGSAFADYYEGMDYNSVFNHYTYNLRGELELADMYRGRTIPELNEAPDSADQLPGRRFAFGYDHLGNRTRAGATGTSADESYAPNELNQYDTRDNELLRVTGTASSEANVAVAGAQSTNKKDRAWAADIFPENVDGPARGAVTVYAAVPGTGGAADRITKSAPRAWFAPPAEQLFAYDADGNLTSDGVWIYTYNAENQLVRMTSELPAGFGFTRKRLDFRYDYMGRRWEKRVVDLDTNQVALERRFVYADWNLIAELDGSGANLVQSYTWGLDLSGSLTSSGGVGALLQIRDHGTSKTFWPTYDGNGNVVALVNAASGELAAIYEYDPFGNHVRAEVRDSSVASNSWRFSTKYLDIETGLAYYGYRYYSPLQGRFINRDPLGEQGGLNLYGFARNNSINTVDYLGLMDKLWWMPLLSRGYDDTITLPEYPVTGGRVTGDVNRYITDPLEIARFFGMLERLQLPELPLPSGESGSTSTKELDDCYAAARAAHSADAARLKQIAEARVESFFGSLAAQQSAARWGVAEAVARVVRDTSFSIVGSYLVGTAASAQWASAAAAGRNLYSAARSWQQVNRIAADVASLQTTANIVRGVSGTGFAVGYSIATSSNSTGATLGSVASTADLMAGNNYSQAGLLIGLTQATVDYISSSGLSPEQVAGVVAGIHNSLVPTQQAIDSRLDAALAECDRQFKKN